MSEVQQIINAMKKHPDYMPSRGAIISVLRKLTLEGQLTYPVLNSMYFKSYLFIAKWVWEEQDEETEEDDPITVFVGYNFRTQMIKLVWDISENDVPDYQHVSDTVENIRKGNNNSNNYPYRYDFRLAMNRLKKLRLIGDWIIDEEAIHQI